MGTPDRYSPEWSSLMSALYELAVAKLAGGRSANDLADALDMDSGEDARAAAMVAVPAVLSNMARVAESPVGAIGLSRMARAQTLSGVTGIGRDGSGRAIPLSNAVAALLGTRTDIVIGLVTEHTGLEPPKAELLLGEASAACLWSLARELGPTIGQSMIAPTLARERLHLVEDGWGVWINRCLGNGNPSRVLELARHISLRPPDPIESVVVAKQRTWPEPEHRSRATSRRRRGRSVAWWLIGVAVTVAMAGTLLVALA